MTEAPRSTSANKLVNCASTFRISGGRLAARSSFGPSAASRDAAVAAVRPWGSFQAHRRPPPATGRRRCQWLPGVRGDPVRAGRLTDACASVVTFDDGGNGESQAGRIVENSA